MWVGLVCGDEAIVIDYAVVVGPQRPAIPAPVELLAGAGALPRLTSRRERSALREWAYGHGYVAHLPSILARQHDGHNGFTLIARSGYHFERPGLWTFAWLLGVGST